MTTLATEARLIRLEVVMRLRRLGWWPWLALAAWILFAVGQEPRMLRTFGIDLCWQGAWAGGAVLLAALASLGRAEAGDRDALRHTVRMLVVAAFLAGAVAVGQAGLAWVADVALGPWTPVGRALSQAAGFALVWLPTALAGVLAAGRPRRGAAKLLLLVPVAFSVGGSALWFSEPTLATVGACALATVGAGCFGALSLRVEAAVPARRTPG